MTQLCFLACPDKAGREACGELLILTMILNKAIQVDFPCFWTSTTHINRSSKPGATAVTIAFGRAMGYMKDWIDAHGAGAQRSDPKAGDSGDFPYGLGPQGDAIRIDNYIRLVRSL